MKTSHLGGIIAMALALPLSACGDESPKQTAGHEDHEGAEGHDKQGKESAITLTDAQIRSAGIMLATVNAAGSGGALVLPAMVEADPQSIQIVTATIGGRVVALNRNLGEMVRRGEPLAIIESREAAQIQGQIEATRARLILARSMLAREERLFAQKVSPEQDVIAARTAATEAGIALRLAQQQMAATGIAAGGLNRVSLPSPIAGRIISRTGMLGQAVAAEAELYRVANLDTVSLSLSLSAADAAPLRSGAEVLVTGPGRSGRARISFLSPILDPQTRLVPVIARLDNRDGGWRIGETVSAAVQMPVSQGGRAIAIPQTAVQTVDGKPSVFVRTAKGFQAVPVATGTVNGDRILILNGLKGGERIAATGSFILKAELGKGEAEHEH